jgi:pre-mRNA-processing factor 19
VIAVALLQGRKKRAKPDDLATADTISAMTQSHKQSGLHSSRSGVITSMAVQASTSRAITGGADKTAVVFDLEKQEVLYKLKVGVLVGSLLGLIGSRECMA